MSRRSRLSEAQFVAIQQDTRRSPAAIAAAYGISIGYARNIQSGRYNRRPSETGGEPTLDAKPSRFYRPFRDGTYPP